MSFLAWLKSFFKKEAEKEIEKEEEEEKEPEAGFSLYKPKERLIYGYFDGQDIVYCDPLELYQNLMSVAPTLDIDIKVANSPMKDANQAFQEACLKVRDIFKVKPYKEGGLTETECMDLLGHFLNFCHTVKKNASESPTTPSEVSSTTNSSSVDSPATTNTSATTSAKDESSIDKPESSPSEPELPSVSSTLVSNTGGP